MCATVHLTLQNGSKDTELQGCLLQGISIIVHSLVSSLQEKVLYSFKRVLCAGSVKACYGHTEGAAGLQGALCSILSLQTNATPPIMHLRNVNPYVSAALSDWRSSSGLEAFIPRVRL